MDDAGEHGLGVAAGLEDNPGERTSRPTTTCSVPLTMKVPLSVITGKSS